MGVALCTDDRIVPSGKAPPKSESEEEVTPIISVKLNSKNDDPSYIAIMSIPNRGRSSCCKPLSSPMHYEVTSIRNLDSAECTYFFSGRDTYFYTVVEPNHNYFPGTDQSRSECHHTANAPINLHSLLDIRRPSSLVASPVASSPANPGFETPSPTPPFQGHFTSSSASFNPSCPRAIRSVTPPSSAHVHLPYYINQNLNSASFLSRLSLAPYSNSSSSSTFPEGSDPERRDTYPLSSRPSSSRPSLGSSRTSYGSGPSLRSRTPNKLNKHHIPRRGSPGIGNLTWRRYDRRQEAANRKHFIYLEGPTRSRKLRPQVQRAATGVERDRGKRRTVRSDDRDIQGSEAREDEPPVREFGDGTAEQGRSRCRGLIGKYKGAGSG